MLDLKPIWLRVLQLDLDAPVFYWLLTKGAYQSPRLHVFNWGMGVESTFILVRWILEPFNRPFLCWHQCIVLTAQTGDEYGITKRLCEQYVLPLLRQENIRLVQVARAGQYEKQGIKVLSDTTQPTTMYTEGAYTLGENMESDGWVPRVGRPHLCAQKWKGWVLDKWITANIFQPFGPYLGYNRDETKRFRDAQDYGCKGFDFRAPMIDQDQSRDDALEYLYWIFRVIWHKSCCDHCPFQLHDNAERHWLKDTPAGARALWRERMALTLNPRMGLFGWDKPYEYKIKSKRGQIRPAKLHSAYQMCIDRRLEIVLKIFHQWLQQSDWCVLWVRKVYRDNGTTDSFL